jgi:Prp8 binding protein
VNTAATRITQLTTQQPQKSAMQKRQQPDSVEEEEIAKKSRYDVAIIPNSSTEIVSTSHSSVSERTSQLLAPTMLLTGHEGAIYSISFDPSGQYLASGSFDNNICK